MASKCNIVLAGRLSGDKNIVATNIIEKVCTEVYKINQNFHLEIVGGPVTDIHRQLETEYPFVQFSGHTDDIHQVFMKSDLVIGAGRVALEAMALQKPVLAAGHGCYIGIIDELNIQYAKETNFGDWSDRKTYNWGAMVQDLLSLIEDPLLRNRSAELGYKTVLSEYNIEKVSEKLDLFYARLRNA